MVWGPFLSFMFNDLSLAFPLRLLLTARLAMLNREWRMGNGRRALGGVPFLSTAAEHAPKTADRTRRPFHHSASSRCQSREGH